MATVDEILSARSAPTASVRLLLDGRIGSELDRLRAELRDAVRSDMLSGGGLDARAPAIEREIAEMERRAEEASVTFVFRAVGSAHLEDLKRRHPPTAGQLERYREAAKANPILAPDPPHFDPAGLMPELLAACAVDPAMTVEEAARLVDTLSDGEVAELFEAAWSVNVRPPIRPTFGIGSEPIPDSGTSSATPSSTGSLSASISAG